MICIIYLIVQLKVTIQQIIERIHRSNSGEDQKVEKYNLNDRLRKTWF